MPTALGGLLLRFCRNLLKASAALLEESHLTEHGNGPRVFAVRTCIRAGRSQKEAVEPRLGVCLEKSDDS